VDAKGLRHRDRHLLTAMQDALLPAGVVALPSVDLAARYLISEDDWSAGGDWFDAVALTGGRVALVVGDVVGQGVAAASTMGQLRAVLAAALLTHGDPLAALEAVTDFVEAVPEARGTTAAVAVVDPRSSSLRYCTAGHPPPLVVRADGSAAFLPATGGGPLGSGTALQDADSVLGEGDLVLLYTDGLVVRPDASPASSMGELLAVATEAFLDGDRPSPRFGSAAERTCERTMEQLTRRTGVSDDVTVLAAQRLAVPTEDLVLDLPALPDTVRVVRLELGAWLAGLRLSAIDQLALQQAVGELVGNAVQHAYPAGSQALHTAVRVRASHTEAGHIEVDVEDDGRWLPRSPTGAHRGLALARGFVDHLDPVPSRTGTHLRVRHRALRPAHLLTSGPVHALRRGLGRAEAGLTIRRSEGGHLELGGAVDALCVDRLAAEVRRSTAGPGEPVVVDLSEVTLLCSGAVQVLSDAVPGAGTAQAPVVLRAPAGSVAELVLDLTRVPYETTAGQASG
jgi:anti-sigma regulatory factor (Ser/Thr protein kinase)/anti-anti-sigma regulatory factor